MRTIDETINRKDSNESPCDPSGETALFFAGLDIGSTATKAAIIHGVSKEVVAVAERATGWAPKEAAREALEDALSKLDVPGALISRTVATGYGRKMAAADKQVTEISCHALGAKHLVPEAMTVLDIGGQDSKMIALDEQGNVRDFLMNDKCAAGTGRFISNMATALGIDLDEFGVFAAKGTPVPISSMCAVFAESEVIGLTASGASREDLAAGIVVSIAKRLTSLAGRISFTPTIAFTGGTARNAELAKCFSEAIGVELNTPVLAPFAGAIGAALIASR
ncbi:acyl-CoA dehydratase activase [Desulfovibrio sp. JC010]|uniref:acyl-CoA dehydratase activase n=1 Tax=Desulfovibrio sp. JC010 TaxID=2593641 RepID=UPI0013D6168B|nr:acyl-CoA dehydratase activase [Desulfovibrio sp. JC010]NDV25421.1 2-hydroxyglutaryl-CoA dehydratase [Desulfovibrio sp. JC010]